MNRYVIGNPYEETDGNGISDEQRKDMKGGRERDFECQPKDGYSELLFRVVFCDLLEYLSQRAVISEVFCDGVG